MRRIYLASSWRNDYQPGVLAALREAGHEVYDFRNPAPVFDSDSLDSSGFAWNDIDPDWEQWSTARFADALNHPIAIDGFAHDLGAMEWADTCVCLLPCGRSAHLEAGWFTGRGLPTLFYLPEPIEPELMYKLGSGVALSRSGLLAALAALG